MKSAWLPALLLLAFVCCPAQRALAQYRNETGLESSGAAPKGWDVTLGAGAAIAPRYPGADDYRAWPIPMVMVRYQDLFFIGPLGAGLNLIKADGWRAGPLIGFQYRRNEGDDPHLSGLGNIALSATAGGFVSYTTGPVQIDASARQAITHTYNGLTARLAADFRVPFDSGKYLPRCRPASAPPITSERALS